jgi:hypothetical protein
MRKPSKITALTCGIPIVFTTNFPTDSRRNSEALNAGLTRPHTYGTKKCRRNCENIVGETAAMVMELLLEAELDEFPFRFKKNLLAQASEKTGMSVEELIEYKSKGEPFPTSEKDE